MNAFLRTATANRLTVGLFVLATLITSCGDDSASETDLDALEFDTLTVPEPTMEGDLCLRLSAPEKLAVERAEVRLDSATGDVVAQFSDLTVGPNAEEHCTMACICVDSSPLFVVVEADGESRTFDTGQTVQGCCESM